MICWEQVGNSADASTSGMFADDHARQRCVVMLAKQELDAKWLIICCVSTLGRLGLLWPDSWVEIRRT